MSYVDFQERIARINDILSAVNLLSWDSRTVMPPGGVGGLQAGDYTPLHSWLFDAIYRHGRASAPGKTLRRVAGEGLNTAPYIADLTAKVEALT